jgi:hypothetical protein
MEIATARAKAREVLERAAAELEELKSGLASEFRRLRDRDQSSQDAETTDDQVRALDNVISAIKAARSVLE